MPPTDPSIPYKRQYTKTKMSWPLALIYNKRVDVLVLVIILLGIFLAFVGVCIFFFIRYLSNLLGWGVI